MPLWSDAIGLCVVFGTEILLVYAAHAHLPQFSLSRCFVWQKVGKNGSKRRCVHAGHGWDDSQNEKNSIEDQSLFRYFDGEFIVLLLSHSVSFDGLAYRFPTHLWWLYDYLAANKSHWSSEMFMSWLYTSATMHGKRCWAFPFNFAAVFILRLALGKFAFVGSRRLLSANDNDTNELSSTKTRMINKSSHVRFAKTTAQTFSGKSWLLDDKIKNRFFTISPVVEMTARRRWQIEPQSNSE